MLVLVVKAPVSICLINWFDLLEGVEIFIGESLFVNSSSIESYLEGCQLKLLEVKVEIPIYR